MDVSALKGKLPKEILESLVSRNISKLTPPQQGAIEQGLLDGNSMVVSSPTASGKTLIAELAALNTIIAKSRKAIYVAPLRALATEKYEEVSIAYPFIKSAISIGDLDSNDSWLAEYEMLFFSTEKLDSLIRHGAEWLSQVGCIIFDEIHLIGNANRGPTMELLITKLASMCDAQMIALSATIANASEIAEWLNAKLVRSDYRPVPLKAGVAYNGKAFFEDVTNGEPLQGTAALQEIRVTEDTLARNKQILVFYATKRNAEAGASRIAEYTERSLNSEQKRELAELSERIANILQNPTEQCIKLSKLVARGAAFHHAGLMNAQRKMVENAFKANLIKVICATTTLSLGINMPAHTVLVRDITRYDGSGSVPLEVSEVHQLFGRAGRPAYDTEGRALLLASNKERIEELHKRYINGKQEPIESNLGIAPVLRTHILALIAENFLNNTASMERFLEKSFYGFQFKNTRHLKDVINQVIEDLMAWDFVTERNGVYMATKVGSRVSELYIDPLSAHQMVEALEGKLDVKSILVMITNTLEMKPHVRANAEIEEMFVSYMHAHKSDALLAIDEYNYDPARAFATAMMLYDWVDEQRDNVIVKQYSTTAGEFYSKLKTADWILYSAIELAKLLKKRTHDMVNLRIRMRYGIKDELMDLVRLQQVGRIRARMLYSNGVKSVEELRANKQLATRLFGSEIAQKIIEQL